MALAETTPLLSTKQTDAENDCSVDIQNDISTEIGHGTSWYASVFLVINAALGAGLLEFPYAFKQSGGILAALIVQAILICFIVGSLFLLAYCSEFRKTTTFPSTVQVLCGKGVEIVSAICIILYTYGTCITFLIVISDQLTQVFRFITNNPNFCDHWYMSKDFTLSISSVVLILPLCFSKRIDFLKYVSFAGVIAVLYVVFLIIAKYAVGNFNKKDIPITTSPSSFMDVFMVIPTVCFSYQCHVSIVPIYSCMKGRTIKNFGKTVLISIFICLFAYSVSATLGYYTFGDKVKQDILSSYTPTWDVVIGVFMIAAKTYTTYPILLYCGRVEVEKLCVYACKLSNSEAERTEPRRRIIIALLWFASTLVIALYVPDIAIVIDVLGGLAALFIFFFPGMCLMKIALHYMPEHTVHKRRFLALTAGAFMVIGAFLFGLVSVQSVMDDINPSTTPAAISPGHCF